MKNAKRFAPLLIPAVFILSVGVGYAAWETALSVTDATAVVTQSLYTVNLYNGETKALMDTYEGLEPTSGFDLLPIEKTGYQFLGYTTRNIGGSISSNSDFEYPFNNDLTKLTATIKELGSSLTEAMISSKTINLYGYNSSNVRSDYIKLTVNKGTVYDKTGTALANQSSVTMDAFVTMIKTESSFMLYNINATCPTGYYITSYVIGSTTYDINDSIDLTNDSALGLTSTNRNLTISANLKAL